MRSGFNSPMAHRLCLLHSTLFESYMPVLQPSQLCIVCAVTNRVVLTTEHACNKCTSSNTRKNCVQDTACKTDCTAKHDRLLQQYDDLQHVTNDKSVTKTITRLAGTPYATSVFSLALYGESWQKVGFNALSASHGSCAVRFKCVCCASCAPIKEAYTI